jgi:predicted component of type VI protein secretion system
LTEVKGKGFRELNLDARVTLIGQLLLTCGTAFLSLGQIFKLLKANDLPTTPVVTQQVGNISEQPAKLYGSRRSYFEN